MSKKILLLFYLFSIVIYAKNISDINITKDSKEYTLEITGVKNLDKDDIAKALGVKDSGLFVFWKKDNQIREDFVQNIKPTLKGYLENHGYFDAKFDIQKINDTIKITIDEGEPIRVTDINIDSNFNIKKLITFKKGDVFMSDKFIDIKDKIITKLLENGYCKYKLNTKAYVDLKKHSAKLNYKLDKDGICHFGDINITKIPKDIKAEVVYSRLKFKKGDRFDIRLVQDSYTALNKLNTFANLQIKYSLEDSNKIVYSDISLDTRKKLKRYMVAIGYDSIIGTRFKALWEKRNFFGNAKKFTIKTELSHNTQSLDGSLFIPAFMSYNKNYLDLYLSAGYEVKSTDGFRQKRTFLNGYFDYNYKHWNAQVGLGIENLGIKLKENLPSIIGGTFNLIYPYVSLTYDSRDSKIDPKNGLYLKWYSEYGLARREGGVQYLKYLFEARGIKTFGDLTLSAVGKIGAIHEVSGKLPASKLFYGGGLFSNRAYGKDDLGIITSNKSYRKLGGKSYVNIQLEANYKLYKKLYGAIFFDSTMISEKEYRFNGKRIDTIGIGLRYKTPVGPVKIDLGYNIHNRRDHAISIMLGQSF